MKKYNIGLFLIALFSLSTLGGKGPRQQEIERLENKTVDLQGKINVLNRKGLYKYDLVAGHQWPVKEIYSSTITSRYDDLRYYFNRWQFHQSTDIFRKAETWVYPSKSGIVRQVKYNIFLGWTVTIEHYNSKTKYCHLDTPIVKENQLVDTEHSIGMVGDTGIWAEGRHLCWIYLEYKDGKYYIEDPVIGKKRVEDYWK